MSASTIQLTPSAHTMTSVTTPDSMGQLLARFPELTTTVPKEFVHRAAVAEVLLTGWARRDDERFGVTAQWPRCHSYFTQVDGHHDPLIVAETIRQIGALLAHTEFDVPLDQKFLMWDLRLTVVPEHLKVSGAPANIDIDVTCVEVRRRGPALAKLRYETVLRRDGQVVATGGASYTCASPQAYERLRRNRPHSDRPPLALTAPVPPQHVGRTSPTDVVLSPIGEENCWQLRADTRHPVLFDHPQDHIPGMVLIEAARQAAHLLLGRESVLPVTMVSEFSRYAELDAPCLIRAEALPAEGNAPVSVLVTGEQEGEPVFSTTVLVDPVGRRLG
ncbi:ScbA/BarX family gamma-butyrolactone biosynthesis protein [Streptomyces sp. Da 82-17]|uniref:ScbA/BarX family gamma-butyrolactone biosynthesis protein n=1 Tax=Streptomyces sp. Da 82-17 TaxID=3377116 RepID=UPI0038D394E9